jgi:hypothetical protein
MVSGEAGLGRKVKRRGRFQEKIEQKGSGRIKTFDSLEHLFL